jgi:hypothetical protein
MVNLMAMQHCPRTPRHETIHSFDLALLDHSEKMNLLPSPFHTCQAPICSYVLKYTLELGPSAFNLLTLDLCSKPLRNRIASKSLSLFPVMSAAKTSRHAPNSQRTPDRKQSIRARTAPASYHTITIPLAVTRLILRGIRKYAAVHYGQADCEISGLSHIFC